MPKTNRKGRRNNPSRQPASRKSSSASSASSRSRRVTQRDVHLNKAHSTKPNSHERSRKRKMTDELAIIETSVQLPDELLTKSQSAKPMSLKGTRKRKAANKMTRTTEDNSNSHDENPIDETFQTEATKTKVIGRNGGSIKLYGCEIVFPRNALKDNTDIQLSVDNDPTSFPGQGIPVTPVISVKPHMKFDVPVKVFMKTSCKAKKGEILAQMWSRESSQDEWIEYKMMHLGDENMIRCEVDHFSDSVTTIANSENVVHLVQNSIFIMRKQAMVSSVFWLDEKSMHDVRNSYQKLGHVKARPVDLVVEGREQAIYNVNVNCVYPENLEYGSNKGNPAEFLLSSKFIRTRKPIAIEFRATPAPRGDTEQLRFEYSLQPRNGEHDPYNDCSIVLNWPIGINVEASNKNIVINNSDVAAGTCIQGGSGNSVNISDYKANIGIFKGSKD